MWNGTMFIDLDWPLNASSLLSASAELLAYYGIEIYANTSKTLLHKLHILNNKLLQCIYCKSKPLSLRFINFIVR